MITPDGSSVIVVVVVDWSGAVNIQESAGIAMGQAGYASI
jgi:hypothetical protein